MSAHNKIAFITLGCKLNFSETSAISREFVQEGYRVVDHKEQADIYVVHSCSVTGNADKKTRSAIRQVHKRNPDARIAVIGCAAQLKPNEIAEMDGVDIILGTNEKFSLPQVIRQHEEKLVKTSKFKEIISFNPSFSADDRTRTFFKVQDGCDNFCSYCTIPLARGKSRSNTIDQTLKLARQIAREGAKEVVLTGVNVGDFGAGTQESFFDLIQGLDQINGIERFRISSIEPDLLSDEIISFVASSQKFMPHFHIPLQSGSDKVLKRMKRNYDTAQFAQCIQLIKTKIPHCFIAADVIVGFPGEMENDFYDTYRFIEEMELAALHVFPYSERNNTVAAKLAGMIPRGARNERSKTLIALSRQQTSRFYRQQADKQFSVLYEMTEHEGCIEGFTENYLRVRTGYNPALANTIQPVLLSNYLEKEGVFLVE